MSMGEIQGFAVHHEGDRTGRGKILIGGVSDGIPIPPSTEIGEYRHKDELDDPGSEYIAEFDTYEAAVEGFRDHLREHHDESHRLSIGSVSSECTEQPLTNISEAVEEQDF